MSVSAADWGALLAPAGGGLSIGEGVWEGSGVRLGDGDPATPAILEPATSLEDGDRLACLVVGGRKVYVLGKVREVAN